MVLTTDERINDPSSDAKLRKTQLPGGARLCRTDGCALHGDFRQERTECGHLTAR